MTRAIRLIVLTLGFGVLTAQAGRPLALDDADPVDAGQFEFEAGVGYVRDTDCDHWDFPVGLAYGLIPGVEVGLEFGGQFVERTEVLDENGTEKTCAEHGLGDLVVGAKWQVIPSCPLGARHALVPSVKFPTADESKGLGSGEMDYDLTWVASRAFCEKMDVHLNMGYSWIGGPDEDVVHYGVALDYRVLDTVQAAGEIFAEKETIGGAETVGQFNIGVRYRATEAWVLDLAAGSRIGSKGPDFTATAGLTWSFDAPIQ